MREREIFCDGAALIAPLLEPHGFSFRVDAEYAESGMPVVEASFRRPASTPDEERVLALRSTFGRVSRAWYHVGDRRADHEDYMDALGHLLDSRFPDIMQAPFDDFRHLATDLERAHGDFVTGDARVLRAAADTQERRKAAFAAAPHRRSPALDSDDWADWYSYLEFPAGRYGAVVARLSALQFPALASPAMRRRLHLARLRLPTSGPGGSVA